MKRSHRRIGLALACVALQATSSLNAADTPATRSAAPPQHTLRVMAIGNVNEVGFWKAVADRFEQATDIKVVTYIGAKDTAAAVFAKGGQDVIMIQSADTIIDLVSDGLATDAQPWVQNDLVLIGPEADPAGVKGTADLVTALKKIAASRSPLVVHDSLGAGDVLRTTAESNGIELPPETTSFLLDDHQRRVVTVAQERKAYTLIARIPWQSGKLLHAGLTEMSAGDRRLLRPYVMALANPLKMPDAHVAEARALTSFLRSPETQAWIADYHKDAADVPHPFTPINTGAATTQPIDNGVAVDGAVLHPQAFDLAALKAMPHQTVTVKDKSGTDVTYAGIAVRDVLKAAGAIIGGRQMKGPEMTQYLVAAARDGYQITFSLAELDSEFSEQNIILADTRDGIPLTDKDGPLRLIVPNEKKQARSMRQVVSLRIFSVR